MLLGYNILKIEKLLICSFICFSVNTTVFVILKYYHEDYAYIEQTSLYVKCKLHEGNNE